MAAARIRARIEKLVSELFLLIVEILVYVYIDSGSVHVFCYN